MSDRDKELQRMTDEEVASLDEQDAQTIHPTDIPDMVFNEDGVIGDDIPDEATESE